MKHSSQLRIVLFGIILLVLSIGISAGAVPVDALGDRSPAWIDWNNGPGGPILVVTGSSSGYGRYYAEILRTEGLNEFSVIDIDSVDASVLAAHDVVILAETALTNGQATMFSDWVTGGGNLIAMRPDARLASLLGITPEGGTLSNAYLLVDTASGPGVGTVNATIQYHGAANLYSLNGAEAVAVLYSDADTAANHPAVTLKDVGLNGGQAAAFAYELARSVVQTRQGNPAWAGTERDGFDPIRAMDMFYGDAASDPQPDWVDFDKIAIPQADEQQRLLAKLIEYMELDRMPLPRFWYFPRDEKAVVVMTGDAHDLGSVPYRFEQYIAASPTGCSVADWECVRSSMYIYSSTTLTNEQAEAYNAMGFEIGVHLDMACQNFTPASLAAAYTDQLAQFALRFPNLPLQASERTHCVTWSDWDSQAAVKQAKDIRLDANYYYWPDEWVQDRPGLFTGSGMPMRLTDANGYMYDVYQAAVQMNDEAAQTYPYTVNTLLDRALGSEGYYGAFTANMHAVGNYSPGSDAIVASAQARGVPIISGRQLVTWLDGRGSSSFSNLEWSGGGLSFHITAAAGANGLRAMLPFQGATGPLIGITRGGSPVTLETKVIKGVQYAFFDAVTGDYEALYSHDTTPPIITGAHAALNLDGTITVSWDTNEYASSRIDYGTAPGTLDQYESTSALVTAHSITLSGLTPTTTYFYRVSSTDSAGNTAVYPQPPAAPLSFMTYTDLLGDDKSADFSAGTTACAYISSTQNGEVMLPPAAGAEFEGTSLPAGWEGAAWGAGGTVAVGSGALNLDNAYARTTSLFTPGHILEFTATFSGATASQGEHVGFGYDLISGTWALFSTGSGGSLKARSSGAADTDLGTSFLNSPHLYRIEWYADHVVYFVDGIQVADHTVSLAGGMRPIASDGADPAQLGVDWIRMSPYSGPCPFYSRILDAGQPVDWFDIYHSGTFPDGTFVNFSTRSGYTPTPDGSWSAWQEVAGTSILSPHGRYIQYQVTLTSLNEHRTPVIASVVLTYAALPSINISGNTDLPDVTLNYSVDGAPQFVTSGLTGNYSLQVPYNWTGTITPFKAGYGFMPPSRSYTSLTSNRTDQNYSAGLCYTLSLAVTPIAGGNVNADPEPNCSGGRYFSSTVVMLTATSNPGYGFATWTGDVHGLSNQTTVTMDGDRSATAVFSPLSSFVGWAGSVAISSDKPVVAVARPHVGAEIASYDGVTGGGLTAYVPMLFKNAFGGSYDAAFYVQNMDTTAADINIKFYDSAGVETCSVDDNLAPLASKGWWLPALPGTCLPDGWVGGAVVTSNKNIVAVGRPHVGAEVMTYNGFSSGTLTSYVPMLFKKAFGGTYDAAFYVQNVGAANASVTIRFYDSTGAETCIQTDTIAPLASKGWWTPGLPDSCLPVGWVGGAIVTSNQPVVTIGRPHVGAQVTSYSGLPEGSPTAYVPMLFKKAFGGTYDAAFYVQNVDNVAADVTIKFYDSAGNLSCEVTDTIAPLASKGWWTPGLPTGCLPAGWVGGAVVTSVQDIVAVGRPHIGNQVTTYPGIAAGNLDVSLPMLFRDAFGGSYDSAFYIQNTDALEGADVTLKFFDADGNLACQRTDTIPALATLGYWLPSVTCE